MYTLAGSPDACRAYSMISRPTPPRRPVEISATTTPITDAVAASLSAGTMHGTAAGKRSLRIVWAFDGGEAAHQLERRRRRRLQPAQRADGDREEGEEGAEHGDRQPARPLPAAEVQPAAPADDERGEGDHRHRLGDDEVRHQAAAHDAEAGHHDGQPDADRRAEQRSRRAARRNEYHAAGEHDHARSAGPTCGSPGRTSREPMSHTCGMAVSLARGRMFHPSDVAAVVGPDDLVQLPRRRRRATRARTKSPTLRTAQAVAMVRSWRRRARARAGMTCSP